MKKLFYFVLALCVTTMASMTSCNNEEMMQAEEDTLLPLKPHVVTRCEVADAMQNIEVDVELVQEIHSLVTNALANGRDEEISFKKMLSDNEQTRAIGSTVMKERLRKLVAESYTRSAEGNQVFNPAWLRGLINSDIIIYWPYSEDWDGEELPTIVVAPEDKDVEDVEGIKITQNEDGLNYEKIMVNEDYALEHPVWVINEKADDPDVIYLNTSNLEKDEASLTRSAGNPLWVWRLTEMKVTHQYDTWVDGGSEFDFRIIYPELEGYTSMCTKFRVNFTRKKINNETWKPLNELMNTNWRIQQINNGLIINEFDGNGKDTTQAFTVSYTDGTNTYSTGVTYTVNDKDDDIGQLVVDRDYALQNSYYSFDNNQVQIIAPLAAE